jgi:hypothetical protein
MKVAEFEREKGSALLLSLLGGAVVAVVLYWFAVRHFYVTSAERGQFGDTFGAINALFTACAFASLLYTVSLQRRELALQRRELEMTRDELSGQREQLQRQNETFMAQSFENTFFQLVVLSQEILRGMRLSAGHSPSGIESYTDGRQVLLAFEEALQSEYARQQQSTTEHVLGDNLVHVFSAVFPRFASELGHYLRNVERILILLDRCEPSRVDEYAGFLRAQLSSSELFLIFYACLGGDSFISMKPLVETRWLLKDIDRARLLNTSHQHLFDQRAFYRVGAA